jgi:hypothetical protein
VLDQIVELDRIITPHPGWRDHRRVGGGVSPPFYSM